MKPVIIEYKKQLYKCTPLTNTLEFISQHNIPVNKPVAAVVNGYLTRLTKKFKVDGTLEIVELSTSQGRRIYESSVLFLFRTAFEKKYPKRRIFINHSLHMGVYAEVEDGELSELEIKDVEDTMKEMVKRNLPLERKTRDWDISMQQLKVNDRQDLINLYRYYTPTIFKYYELDGVEESLYLPQLPSTGHLSHFKLQKYQEGIVIIIPDFEDSSYALPEFVDRPKLFNTYKEYHEWSRILKVRTVGQLNRYVMNGEITELMKVAEALHEKKVAEIADTIGKKENPPKVVLIAGPSSSGKTTFSKRLGIQLRVNRLKPIAINLDNYFVDREQTPKDKEGNYDFEALEAIDVDLFNEHLQKLINGEEVEVPRFDFQTGKKKKVGIKLQLKPNEIMIIEGIHGLNPKLTSSIAEKDKFKVYISALTQLNTHRHDRIPTSDTRLIRRLVRDSYFRGYGATETLERWRLVRAGEKINIFPLQENADMIFNSALFYEMGVLKLPAERELRRVERTSPVYAEARRLLKFLSFFLPVDSIDVPKTSILKEFIGGSSFKY